MTESPSRHLNVYSRGAAQILQLLDRRITEHAHIQSIHTELKRVTDAAPDADSRVIVLDFSRVEFLSSAMLSVLVALEARVQRSGRTLILAGLTETLHSIFRMTKLHRILTIHADVDAAVASLPRTIASGA